MARPKPPTLEEAQSLLGECDPEQVRKVLSLGRKAWPYRFKGAVDALRVRHELESLPPGEKRNGAGAKRYRVAGRLRSKRGSGGIAFLDIEGESAKIQVVLDKAELGERFDEVLHILSEGDWVGAVGYGMRTKRGEPSVGATAVEVLAKAVVPFPDLQGAENPAVRYGRPYIHLMQGPKERGLLLKRSDMTKALRRVLEKEGFAEAAIPVLERSYGGANATPFVTHSNAKDASMYLRISHELPLKKLLVGGIERVYHIGPAFRNEDIDTTHNPEFTLLECYAAYVDYRDMMRLTEKLVRAAAVAVVGGTTLVRRAGEPIEFGGPFRRITMKEAIREASRGSPEAAAAQAPDGLVVDELSDEAIQAILAAHHVVVRGGYARGLGIAKLFEIFAEAKLVQPTFVIDHPRETTPLCKELRRDASLVERFELFVGGREHANAYSELNDPILQAKLFRVQEERRQAGDAEAPPSDQDFLDALKFGMPPAGGVGIGVDRLAMTLLDVDSIKQVLPFPQVK
ncbi:MAG: lysine--tRNA ligase [Thermoplasmatota archaeon]